MLHWATPSPSMAYIDNFLLKNLSMKNNLICLTHQPLTIIEEDAYETDLPNDAGDRHAIGGMFASAVS